MRKSRTYNTRLIRRKSSYSVQDVAELFRLHKNAVLRWLRDGLDRIDEKKPYFIYGETLAEYLQQKQQKRKHKCASDEFFCCKCRMPRKPWEHLVDIKIQNQKKLIISGVCVACGTAIRRIGATKKLIEYQKIFLVQALEGQHIDECSK